MRARDTRVRWVDADSSIGGGAPMLASAQSWRFEATLSDSAGRPTLGALAASTTRTIELRLDTARVDVFTVRLHAQAENAHYVPETPPTAGDTRGAFDGSRRIARRAGFGAIPVMSDLIDITFGYETPQLERQAAVDSIGGWVVGGYRRRENGDGTYVVRIPRDSSGMSLVAALKKVRAQGVVSLAMPVDAEEGATRYADWRTPTLVRGCVTLRIELSRESVTAVPVPSMSCGPIVPVLTGDASYDTATQTLALPIAIENQWAREVVAPLELYAWNDSIVAGGPAALVSAPGRRFVEIQPPPEGGWSDDGTIHSGVRWSYDAAVSKNSVQARIQPGRRSPTRFVNLRVKSGARAAFLIRLRVETRNAHPVDPVPDHVPAWIYADSALDGGFSKRVLEVSFKYGASPSAKQAAIDSVRGRVVGGYPISETYLVQVPSDGTLDAMSRLAKTLEDFPQVLSASVTAKLILSPN
jgi:hypothetical protein